MRIEIPVFECALTHHLSSEALPLPAVESRTETVPASAAESPQAAPPDLVNVVAHAAELAVTVL